MNNDEQIGQTLLSLILDSLGPVYVLLLPLSAIVSFVFVLILIIRGKGTMAAVSILLFVSAPILVGVFGCVHGLLSFYFVILNGGGTPDLTAVTEANSAALIPLFVGMFFSIPTYLVAAIGTLARSFGSNVKSAERDG